jgi:hypothetical protein
MNEITDYAVAQGETVDQLEHEVKNRIKQGFQPSGGAAVSSIGGVFLQAMVKFGRPLHQSE